MKIALIAGHVEISEPGPNDLAGKPTAMTRSMTLEQYERHARDAAFVAEIGADMHAQIMAARQAEIAAAADAAAPAIIVASK